MAITATNEPKMIFLFILFFFKILNWGLYRFEKAQNNNLKRIRKGSDVLQKLYS
jgi:hypothetical protein